MAADMCHVDVTGVHLISIHAPPRGATTVILVLSGVTLFQFTPLREGRPYKRVRLFALTIISIHALPRGATVQRDLHFSRTLHISIPAPPRGATQAARHQG